MKLNVLGSLNVADLLLLLGDKYKTLIQWELSSFFLLLSDLNVPCWEYRNYPGITTLPSINDICGAYSITAITESE